MFQLVAQELLTVQPFNGAFARLILGGAVQQAVEQVCRQRLLA
jgi:hypothetical protein